MMSNEKEQEQAGDVHDQDADVKEHAHDEAINQQVESSAESSAETEVETRDEEMERLRVTADEADKRVLMAQAEAENFRKRMRRDFEDQVKFAALPLVAEVLDVRDNLMRAIDAAADAEGSAALRDGVAMVVKQLDDTLGKYGVREIPSQGELFDPNFHEAISQMPSEEFAEGIVAHVAVTGFQMHDRVVRPSQVVVSTGSGDGSN